MLLKIQIHILPQVLHIPNIVIIPEVIPAHRLSLQVQVIVQSRKLLLVLVIRIIEKLHDVVTYSRDVHFSVVLFSGWWGILLENRYLGRHGLSLPPRQQGGRLGQWLSLLQEEYALIVNVYITGFMTDSG